MVSLCSILYTLKDKMENLEFRMYGLVPYNISPIQQGIQYGHGVVEYSLYANALSNGNPTKDAYTKWATKDKTFIILNGGTTNARRFNGEYVGTLNQHEQSLRIAGIPVCNFHEPDLGDTLTAVIFLVNEKVFDRKKYPDFEVHITEVDKLNKLKREGKDYTDLASYEKWKNAFGEDADKVVFLRDFLKQFRLA
jgi:hypothetical protein